MQAIPHRIVILTGAGISKESGLDTFRGEDGTWSRVPIHKVATPEAYARDPVKVLEFSNMRRRRLQSDNIRPNAAHRALAALESRWPGDVLVVTQNTDNLHERAGQRNLVHMHGEALKARCAECDSVHGWTGDLTLATGCVACGTVGRMRPHVVWFGEMPLEMRRIGDALAACALFVSIGTSGVVYPAAGFVREARRAGAHTVELNLEPSEGHSLFHERRYGPATAVVPEFVAELVARLEA